MTDDEPRSLNGLARGFRKRTLVTARLATKAGFGMLGKTLRPNARAKDRTDEQAEQAAAKLVAELDGLKGILMKFGQMASYLDGALPPAAQKVLAQLQAESTPMSYPLIADIVAAELGSPPDECFDEFDEQPFAAASIGQVHRAVLDGRDLAVKVQYPDMEATFRSDLRTLGTLTRVATVGSPLAGGDLVAELRERIEEECDYRCEADNQRLFRALLRDHPHARVPDVVAERSSKRVLTSEKMAGQTFAEFRDNASREARNKAAAIIFEVCMSSIFRHATFNADPHPGNYLFAHDGAVVFLDYGCIKRFSVDFIERWKRFVKVVLSGQRQRFPDALCDLGLVAKTKGFDWDYQWQVFQFLYTPFISPQPYTYTREHVARSYDVMMWKNPNKFKLTLPRDWLFVNRLQWGLQSVIAHLDASADWRSILWPLVDGPTLRP